MNENYGDSNLESGSSFDEVPPFAMTNNEIIADLAKFETAQHNLESKKDSMDKVMFYKLMGEYEEKLQKLRSEIEKRGIII